MARLVFSRCFLSQRHLQRFPVRCQSSCRCKRSARRLPVFERERKRGHSFMRRLYLLAAAVLLAASLPASATVFATVHGVVHDPQHRPIAGASVTLQAADSDFALHATTNADGEFELPEAPIGVYRLTVTAAGFDRRNADTDCGLRHESGAAHPARRLGGATQSVVVHGTASCGRHGDANDADHAADDR